MSFELLFCVTPGETRCHDQAPAVARAHHLYAVGVPRVPPHVVHRPGLAGTYLHMLLYTSDALTYISTLWNISL